MGDDAPAGAEGQARDTFGNHIYLEKQDKLRELGIPIQTSQIVVVGGQSSGKSSLLESLTGFSFPRAQEVCTRFATQITLRRGPDRTTTISITPRPDADDALKTRLAAFRRQLAGQESADVVAIIEEASSAMGIRSSQDAEGAVPLPMFSDDILKIEMSAPGNPHLTVIDVPGLFHVVDEGRTTQEDKGLVETMVRKYMENERTIVLAVVSCMVDPATERILQLAKEADTAGVRTLGVLTKADLVKEDSMLQVIANRIRSDRALKLGWFVVRNRGADQDKLNIEQCRQQERAMFASRKWAAVNAASAGMSGSGSGGGRKAGSATAALGSRLGVDALRRQLEDLLADLARREFPKQRAEAHQRLEACRRALRDMGDARDSPAAQRGLLTQLSARFERVARDALEGHYEGDPIFDRLPALKLVTQVMNLNERFACWMEKAGHALRFADGAEKEEAATETLRLQRRIEAFTQAVEAYAQVQNLVNQLNNAWETFPELHEIIDAEPFDCPEPSDNPIMDHIAKSFRESRGPELGTFGGSMLANTFREQAQKWGPLTRDHVRNVILAVHRFICTLLVEVVPDERMRVELWESVLLQRLMDAYGKACEHTKFLLEIELQGRPMTYNDLFSQALQKAQAERLRQDILAKCGDVKNENQQEQQQQVNLSLDALATIALDKTNAEQVKETIHDILSSYYKVARKRFVDVIAQQAVDYSLLSGPGSPLRVLCPGLISGMSDEELELIAGEDAATKQKRRSLMAEEKGWSQAVRVLRG